VSAAATFTFGVPMAPGPAPKSSLIEMEGKDSEGKPLSLTIRGNDDLFLGFRYKNDKGEEQWITRRVCLTSPGVLFDVMNKDYAEVVSAVHVGNSVYFRVINPSMDVSEERDKVTVGLTSSSGATNEVEMTETFAHSGVFKGLTKFSYATAEATNEPGVLPVTYGAKVTARYQPTNDLAALDRFVDIFKGADGDILPFSKRFRDPSIAVKTQLAIAEAYFELAKQHRRLNQKELSKNEISEGKRILEEAVSEYPDTETRAQADYLLANLSMEFAEDAPEIAEKEKFYREAVLRFRDIVTMHSETTYAPKAQYKKALALEKLGDFDVACEEYVKLSYRWPDHELIAETIARLGQYFYRKGKEITDQAAPIQDAVEKEKIMMQARDFFRTSAEVFGRLAARFPTHKLADKTTVLAGQCYMRAEEYQKAIAAFKIVVDNADADKEAKPEAMYWCGDSWTKLGAPSGGGKGAGNLEAFVEAYRMFKKLTWDYPASKWAKYARGRLAEPQFARIDTE
jgi:tetratricopeptide (TPR) repeat protein